MDSAPTFQTAVPTIRAGRLQQTEICSRQARRKQELFPSRRSRPSAAPQESFGSLQRHCAGILNLNRPGLTILPSAVSDGEDGVSHLHAAIVTTSAVQHTGTTSADQDDAAEVGCGVGTPNGRSGVHQSCVELKMGAQRRRRRQERRDAGAEGRMELKMGAQRRRRGQERPLISTNLNLMVG